MSSPSPSPIAPARGQSKVDRIALDQHLPALDGLRALAVLMVITGHFLAYALPTRPPKFVLVLASFGGTGVDLFFVLSGFLITRILLRTRNRPHHLANFYMRRVLRIFPLYYGFLLVVFVILPTLGIGEKLPFATQFWYWTYLQNAAMTFLEIPVETHAWQAKAHFWSLAVEEHFYMVWPFVASFLPRRQLRWVLLSTIPIALATRCALQWGGHPTSYFTLCRIDALALGSLLAVLTEESGVGPSLKRYAMYATLGILPLGAASFVLLSGSRLPVVQILKDSGTATIYTLVMVLVLALSKESPLYRLLASPSLGTIGKYSYGMYVLHWIAISVYQNINHLFWPPLGWALTVLAVLLMAMTSWVVLEQPFLRLKKYFEY